MSRLPQAITLWLTTTLILALAACGRPPNLEPTPRVIHYGEDLCEICGMIISQERHTAAYVTSDGHGHAFEDIGDMVRAHEEHHLPNH